MGAVLLQIFTQVVPMLIKEYNRRKRLSVENKTLHVAVLEHEQQIEGLSIQKVIEIGAKK